MIICDMCKEPVKTCGVVVIYEPGLFGKAHHYCASHHNYDSSKCFMGLVQNEGENNSNP